MLLLATELLEGCCSFAAFNVGSLYAAAEAPPGMLASFNGFTSAAIFVAGTLYKFKVTVTYCSDIGIHFTFNRTSAWNGYREQINWNLRHSHDLFATGWSRWCYSYYLFLHQPFCVAKNQGEEARGAEET